MDEFGPPRHKATARGLTWAVGARLFARHCGDAAMLATVFARRPKSGDPSMRIAPNSLAFSWLLGLLSALPTLAST